MRAYKAFFKGREADLEAASLYEARLKAEEIFKPRKGDRGLLSVILADRPIDPASL